MYVGLSIVGLVIGTVLMGISGIFLSMSPINVNSAKKVATLVALTSFQNTNNNKIYYYPLGQFYFDGIPHFNESTGAYISYEGGNDCSAVLNDISTYFPGTQEAVSQFNANSGWKIGQVYTVYVGLYTNKLGTCLTQDNANYDRSVGIGLLSAGSILVFFGLYGLVALLYYGFTKGCCAECCSNWIESMQVYFYSNRHSQQVQKVPTNELVVIEQSF